MTDLERVAMASSVLCKEEVDEMHGYISRFSASKITFTDLVNLCLSHERLRMELAGAELMIGQLDAEIAALREATK